MKLGEKIKQIVGAVAPTLGTALGGPFGALAGKVLSTALGTPDGDSGAIETALASGDPATLLKLKQAETDLQAKLAELGVQQEQLAYADAANARAREVSVKDKTPRNLAYMILGGTLVMITCELMGWTAATSESAGVMIGYLISECKAALAYYFGSAAPADTTAGGGYNAEK